MLLATLEEEGREGRAPLPPSPGTPATWKRGRNNGRSEVRRGCSRSGHCWPTCSLEQTRLIDFVEEHMGTSTATLSPPPFFLLHFSHFFVSSTFVSSAVSLTSNLIVTVFTTGFFRGPSILFFHQRTPIPPNTDGNLIDLESRIVVTNSSS